VRHTRIVFSIEKKGYSGDRSQITSKDPVSQIWLSVNYVETNSTPSRMNTWSLKLLQKSNRLKLPEIRRPEEVGKTEDPNYCLYHRMLEYPTKSYCIFKDVLQALIDAEVLKLHPE